jgi:hypothetical protein
MATPRIVTIRDFNTSRYAQLADTSSADMGAVLAGAEQAIEKMIRRPIVPTTFVERYRPSNQILYLRKRPVISITSIQRRYSPTSTSFSTVTDYYSNFEEGILEVNTPIQGYVIDITYVAGFEETPEDIKQAILMKAAMLMFQDFELYGSGDSKAPGITYINDEICALIEPYRQINTAYTR